MKQRLLKTMLLVAGLLLGANVAWADPTVGSVDFVAKSRSTYSEGTWTTAGNAGNGYALALADLSGLTKIANATTITLEFDAEVKSGGRIWIGIGDKTTRGETANGSSKSTYNTDGIILQYGTGNGTTVLANGAGVADAFVLSHFVFTLDRTNGKYSYTVTDKNTSAVLKSESNVATSISNATVVEAYSWVNSMSCSLGAVSYSYEVATSSTSYTVKFVDGTGTDLKTAAVHEDQVIGGTANATAAEMAAFDANEKHYVLDTEATTATSIASLSETASENVITLVFKEVAPVASLKVNYMLGETLIDSQDGAIAGLYVSESASVPYRMYIQKNGKLYKANTSGETAWYKKTTTLTENTVVEVAVSEVDLKGGQIALLADLDNTDAENAGVRASYCSAYNNTAFTSTEVLPAGTYTFIIKAMNKGRGSSIAVGETTVCGIADINASNNSWTDKTIENVVIPAAGNLTLVKGGSNTIDCYDIIIAIRQTANYTVKFMAGETELKDAVIVNGFVGETVDIDALKAKFDKDGVIYAYASDDAAEKTIAADGNTVVTIMFAVDTHFTEPMLTFQGRAGEEVSLTFGAWNTEDYYGVDFGDGTIQKAKVGIDNKGPKKEDGTTGSATTFTGTVGADGIIKVYGENDVWYLVTTNGAVPTTFDQAKLMNVVQMSITGSSLENVALPAYPYMTQFSFNNSPVKTVDVSKVASLMNLGIVYSSLYDGEMNLEGIDLQSNTELTDLSIQSQKTGVNAKLKEIDLSKNTKLVNIYLPNNSLTNVILPSEFTKKDANDETVFAKVSMFLNGNKLTAIDGLDKLPAKSTVNISNNLFTLATLPVKPTNVTASKYTYAPQPAYEVAELVVVNDIVDLSSQLTAVGVGTEPATTTYSFVTGGETPATLVEGTDYEVVEPGKFKFLTAQTEKVYGVMATTAFPKFTGANAYKTTKFDVMALEDVTIDASDITEGDITTAIATKTAGKLVKNITINLAKDVAYTVSAPIVAPASLFINGNGASITAATTLITTPAGDLAEWMDGNLIVKDATIDLGANAFYVSAGKNYLYNDFKIENCVVKSSASIVFDFRKGGVAKVFTIDKSTVYSPTATTNSIYSSQSAQKGIEAPGVTVQTFAITNSTLYNFAYGKNFFTHRQNGQKWLAYNVENSIFVNCGKSGQFIKGMNGGQGGANPTWIVDGNIFNFDGVDTSASESTGDSDHTGDEVPGLNETVQNSIAGVVTFTDAVNGDFNAQLAVGLAPATPTVAVGDPRWTITAKQVPTAVVINAADITEGDITTAVTTKTAALTTAGYLVGDITINLAKDVAYTVTAPIEIPAALTINGNGATIDGSALTTPMIQLSATQTGDKNEKEAFLSDGIIVKDVTITGLKYQFIYGNKVKVLLAKVEVENAVIGIDGTNKKTVFDFNGGGNASEILINNSTIYANPALSQAGGLFSSQSGHGSIQDLGSTKQLFAITNSTIYNISYNANTSSQRRNNTAGMEYKVENSVIVNSGKSGQFIVGLNGGSANSAQTYTASGNIFNFDGADVSANEQAKVQEKITTFEMTSIAGVLTFTDAANGNFAGNVEMPYNATEPTTKPGDPRWTLTYSNAPQKYAITVAETTNGTAVADKKEAAAGEKVTITVTPAAGFELNDITGVTATAVEGETDKYEFTMPAEAVTVTVTFKQATGIQSVKAADLNDAVIYNLNGARVSKAGKGLYIINGKKVVIK